MANKETTLKDIETALYDISNEIQSQNKQNDFGNTVGDELHNIEWRLGELYEVQTRIADALEKIANK
jgi:hypothetical protein